jgi:transcriptional regulator with XRE-family HTH domain
LQRLWYFKSVLQKQLGQRIAELRKDRGLTQVQLARSLDCSVEFISLVERGVNAPSVARLENFANVLKVEVIDLFKFTRRKPTRARTAPAGRR